jgi:hypothetical protein
LDVFEEAADGDEAAAVRVGEEFVHVAGEALRPAYGFENRAVVCTVEKFFEQFGDGQATGEGVEMADDLSHMSEREIGRFA